MSRKPKPATREAVLEQQARAARPVWQSPLLWVGVLIVLAGIVTAAATLGGSDDDTTETLVTQTAFAEILGTPLPPLTSPDPAIGSEVPALTGYSFSGEPTHIAADGTARLYGFFAHWCPHCQRELPAVVDWLAANDLPAGVEVVAISTAVDQSGANYPPSDWFEREEWPTTVVVDSESRALANGFGLTGFPYWVAVDANGRVVNRIAGSLSQAQFAATVQQIAPPEAAAVDTNAASASVTPTAKLVSAVQGAAIQSDPPDDLVILDVRTAEEFAEGHLEGATMLDFYRDDFADRLAELDPNVPYLVYCRSGNRSGQATAIMEQLGFTDVTDVDGGIVAWNQAGLPTVTQ